MSRADLKERKQLEQEQSTILEPIVIVILLALVLSLLTGCSETHRLGTTEKGALTGAALGTGLGAVVGNQSGHAGEGAAIGGATGAIAGGLIGRGMEDDDDRYRARYEYDDRYRRRYYDEEAEAYEDYLRRRERELAAREEQLERERREIERQRDRIGDLYENRANRSRLEKIEDRLAEQASRNRERGVERCLCLGQ